MAASASLINVSGSVASCGNTLMPTLQLTCSAGQLLNVRTAIGAAMVGQAIGHPAVDVAEKLGRYRLAVPHLPADDVFDMHADERFGALEALERRGIDLIAEQNPIVRPEEHEPVAHAIHGLQHQLAGVGELVCLVPPLALVEHDVQRVIREVACAHRRDLDHERQALTGLAHIVEVVGQARGSTAVAG